MSEFKCCEMMSFHLSNEDQTIHYSRRFREYGIPVCDGSSSVITISFCPWCGAKLPGSLSEAWFDKLDELGLEPSDDIPIELTTDEWWKSNETGSGL